MMVIVLQERNADPPAALPNGVGIVTGSAERLHMIAMALADSDYQEYPDIKKEIEDAAEAVRKSSVDLNSALNSLMTTNDKASGWALLVESCKVMSSKTIRLLQIVYGAEKERVFRAAQKALDALNQLNPLDARNGKDFAQKASEAATQANQLAAYVRDRATDAPPEKRKELLGLADELNNGAQTLINDANQLLRDPTNPNLQRNVANDINDVKGTINRAVDALKDMDTDFSNAANDFENRSNALADSLRELGAAGQDSYDEDILLTAKKERQQMDNLLDDIDSGNNNAAQEDLRNAKLLNDKLGELAQMEQNLTNDPKKKNQLQQAKRELEQVFPGYQNAANNAINNPTDNNMDQLDDAHDRLDQAIQKLCDIVGNTNAQIGASARKELEDLDELRNAARGGDNDGLGRAAKSLIKENKCLTGLCGAQADKTTDPLRKRQISEAVEELQRLLPHELLSAKGAIQNPSPETLKQLEDKTDTMKDQVNATATISKDYPELDLLDAAKREKNLLNGIEKAGNDGNSREVNNIGPRLEENTKKIGDIAREIAKKKDRPTQAKILDSINKLDRLVGPTINDAKALASNPGNQQQKEQLGKKVNDMKSIVDKLVADTDAPLLRECLIQLGNLHNMKNCADENDMEGMVDSTKATADRQKRLAPIAKAAAQRTQDPTRKKRLLEDTQELDNLLPRGVGQANQFMVNPNDNTRGNLKDTVSIMEGLVKGIADPTKYDPNIPRGTGSGGDLARMLDELVKTAEYSARNPNDQAAKKRLLDILNNLPLDMLDSDGERLANLIRDQNKNLENLCKNAEQGNKPGVEQSARDLLETQKNIREQASKMADKLLDPEKQKIIHGALDELDKLLPTTVQAARGVAANPRDQLAKKRMYDLADDCRDQLSILADNAISTQEQRLREAAKLEKDALARLRKAVAGGDVPGANNALADVKKYNDILTEEGRNVAGEIRDPTLNQRILDTVNELEKLMPIMDADCRNGAANPRNQAAQKRAMDDINKCENLIDSLLNDTKADAIALAQIEDGALTQLEQHVKAGNPLAANDVKKVIGTQNDLKVAATKAAEQLQNPRSKQNIQNALAELDQLLPFHVNNAKAVLQNLNDSTAKDRVGDSTTRMRAPLAQIIATLRPTPENIADANRRREAALLAQLREAARLGDKEETEKLLPAIKGVNDRLVNLARNEATKANTPEKQKALNDAANELEHLQSQLPAIARAAAANPNDQKAQAELAVHTQKMENAMDRIVETLRDKQESPAAKARRLANALIRGLQSGNMDPNKFLAGAKALADYINSLNLNGDFDLDAELAALEKNSRIANSLGRKKIDQPLDGILKDMKKKPPPKKIETKPPPQTFDEHIQAVADDIGNHLSLSELGEGDEVTILIRAIAAELSKLADSAKAGERQNMVQAGRNACQRINELHKLLGTYANRCKDPRTKERLLRAMQAMKNYSVQLKILTAVKAASGKEKDADTEDQLVSVAKGLGNALNESVTSVKVMKGANLLR